MHGSEADFENHQSVQVIKAYCTQIDKFHFWTITVNDVSSKIKMIDVYKPSVCDGIPAYAVLASEEIISVSLTITFNNCIAKEIFPSSLKKSCWIPLFKKGSQLLAEIYRPIIILSQIDKIFESTLCDQLTSYMESKFPNIGLCLSQKIFL